MIKALVLDFDGLILDTETPFRESWREIYAEHGLTVTPEAWASLLGSSSDPPEAYELLEQHLSRSVDRKGIHARRLAREAPRDRGLARLHRFRGGRPPWDQNPDREGSRPAPGPVHRP